MMYVVVDSCHGFNPEGWESILALCVINGTHPPEKHILQQDFLFLLVSR
jgi:hypothetical protein